MRGYPSPLTETPDFSHVENSMRGIYPHAGVLSAKRVNRELERVEYLVDGTMGPVSNEFWQEFCQEGIGSVQSGEISTGLCLTELLRRPSGRSMKTRIRDHFDVAFKGLLYLVDIPIQPDGQVNRAAGMKNQHGSLSRTR